MQCSMADGEERPFEWDRRVETRGEEGIRNERYTPKSQRV
jgi:hypothetical protein